MKIKLIDSVVRSFKVAKIFRENTDKINAIDFAPNGEHLISCSEDDQIVIYDCEKGDAVAHGELEEVWSGFNPLYARQQHGHP